MATHVNRLPPLKLYRTTPLTASLAAANGAACGQTARFRNDVYDAGPNGEPNTDIDAGSVGITDASRYGTIFTSSIAASK